jgi:RNA polymerase sigma factor (sigma-70 family)
VRKWIFSVVRNRNIDLLRSRATRQRMLGKAEAEAPSSQPGEPFALYWHDFRRDLLREALVELPHAQRMVLALAHFSELTHAQIAEHLCVPLWGP